MSMDIYQFHLLLYIEFLVNIANPFDNSKKLSGTYNRTLIVLLFLTDLYNHFLTLLPL